MRSKFRIIRSKKGYIVEVEDIKWTFFGIKKTWKPYVKVSGLDYAWNHSTFDFAMMNLLKEVEIETIKNNNFSHIKK